MRAFTFAVLGWVSILLGCLMGSDGAFAGGTLSCFFFGAALITSLPGIRNKRQRVWNIAALCLTTPSLVAAMALVIAGVMLGS